MSSIEQLHKDMVTLLVKPADDIVALLVAKPQLANIWHMGTGVSGEAGELLDAIKKHVVYGKDADIENIVEELGDIEFYLEGIRQHFNIKREETLKRNRAKLLTNKNARYAEGSYSDEQAQNRADKRDLTTPLLKALKANMIVKIENSDYQVSSTNPYDYAYYMTSAGWRVSGSTSNEAVLQAIEKELGPL